MRKISGSLRCRSGSQGYEESFGGDGYAHSLVCEGSLMSPHMSKLNKLYTLNMYSLQYVNYTSINQFLTSMVLTNNY